VSALDMVPSDHCPCLVTISTKISTNKVFRFENYWLKHQDFQNVLAQSWNSPQVQIDAAKLFSAKLKSLRKNLREWQRSLQSLKTVISNVKNTLLLLEVMSKYRDLRLPEWNFHKILEKHLLELLDK
jgi:hypothetical protein